jgi:serpin B
METMRRRMHTVVVGCVLLGLALSTCGDGAVDETAKDGVSGSPARVELASSKLARAQPAATDDDLRATAGATNAFALDLYREWTKKDANLVFSPYSISLALAMTESGARGETADELRRALHLTLAGDKLHGALNALDQQIAHETSPVPGTAPLEITVANSLWGQAGYPFRSPFLDLLAHHYGAGLRLVDYSRDPEGARVAINAWAAKATRGRVTDVIPDGVINARTRLVLADAIWFRAQWIRKFSPQDTRAAAFHTVDGRTVRVPMMSLREHKFAYGSGDGYQVVELPYWGGYTMTAILPAEGRFADFERTLSPARLDEILSGLHEAVLDLQLPKFEFHADASLKQALAGLGVKAAFRPPGGRDGADFTGMTDGRELFLRDVLHKAFISVNEHGTEAAAATAAVAERVSGAPPAVMHLDRPFVFLIRHRASGTILFMGRVTDPTSSSSP